MKSTVSSQNVPQEMLVTQHEITGYLLAYCRTQTERAERLSPTYARLWGNMTTILEAGGKRLRPYLFLLAYESCGGLRRKDIIPLAAAWELLHAGLLVQDDIIDRDYSRHGQANIGGLYRTFYDGLVQDKEDAAHFADGAAMLAGDLFLSAAQHVILDSGLPNEIKVSALKHINKAFYEVVGGELMDMEAVMLSLESVDVRSIALLKTAVYSVVGPLVAGAAAADADITIRQALDRFGAAVGMGYQLRDDLLGVFGDTSKTGKSSAGDLHEAKRTLLMQETLHRASAKDRQHIEQIMENPPVGASDIAWLKQQIESCGAREAVEKSIAECEQRALHALDDLPITQATRERWLWIVRYSLYRDH